MTRLAEETRQGQTPSTDWRDKARGVTPFTMPGTAPVETPKASVEARNEAARWLEGYEPSPEAVLSVRKATTTAYRQAGRVSSPEVVRRVRDEIVKLVRKHGSTDLAISCKELARRLNLSRPTVWYALQVFIADGVLVPKKAASWGKHEATEYQVSSLATRESSLATRKVKPQVPSLATRVANSQVLTLATNGVANSREDASADADADEVQLAKQGPSDPSGVYMATPSVSNDPNSSVKVKGKGGRCTGCPNPPGHTFNDCPQHGTEARLAAERAEHEAEAAQRAVIEAGIERHMDGVGSRYNQRQRAIAKVEGRRTA